MDILKYEILHFLISIGRFFPRGLLNLVFFESVLYVQLARWDMLHFPAAWAGASFVCFP